MPPRKTATLEARQRPLPPDFTYLPPGVKDLMESRGYALTLDSKSEIVVGTQAVWGRYPLTTDDLPESRREELVKALKDAGYKQSPEGTFGKADCYIYVQSIEAREAFMAEGFDRWAKQDLSHHPEAEASGFNSLIGNADWGRVVPMSGGGLSSHVNPT